MHILPIQTRVFTPPQDDVYAELLERLPTLQPGDILAVSSKIISLHEGRCVASSEADKATLAAAEAECIIPRSYWPTPLYIKQHAFIGGAGVDASNANGYYILLPEDPFWSAQQLLNHLRAAYNCQDLGVIITDSHSTPMRRGSTGIAIGYAGFNPLRRLVGTNDIFGRPFTSTVVNIVDGLAAAATVVMGEGTECQPAALIREVAPIEFTDDAVAAEHLVPYHEDTFRVLYEDFLS